MKRKKWWVLYGIILLCFGTVIVRFREDIHILKRKKLSPVAPVRKPREGIGVIPHGVEMTDEEYKLLRMVISAKVNVFYGPFFADYRKSIDDALKIAPFPLNHGDTSNLRKQIIQYRRHIVDLIKELENGITSDNNDSANAQLLEYSRLLNRFDEEHFIFKAEFVQCFINGDNISNDARDYLWLKRGDNSLKIRALKNKHDSRKELDNLYRLDEFYALLLYGMSFEDYYGQGDYNVGL